MADRGETARFVDLDDAARIDEDMRMRLGSGDRGNSPPTSATSAAPPQPGQAAAAARETARQGGVGGEATHCLPSNRFSGERKAIAGHAPSQHRGESRASDPEGAAVRRAYPRRSTNTLPVKA